MGTRRHYVTDFMGRPVKNSYEVKTYERNQRVVLESMPDSTVTATNEVLWASEGTGTRVTMSVEGKPKGVLRFAPGAVLEAAFHDQIFLQMLKSNLLGFFGRVPRPKFFPDVKNSTFTQVI